MLLVLPALAGISRAAWLTKCSTTTTFYHQCHLRWNRYYPHLLIVNIDDILCTNHFPIHQILPKFSGVPEEELKSDFNRKVARNNGLSNFPVELRLQFLLWDPVGPPQGIPEGPIGSHRVPGDPREFGNNPSRPKIEKRMQFAFFNF